MGRAALTNEGMEEQLPKRRGGSGGGQLRQTNLPAPTRVFSPQPRWIGRRSTPSTARPKPGWTCRCIPAARRPNRSSHRWSEESRARSGRPPRGRNRRQLCKHEEVAERFDPSPTSQIFLVRATLRTARGGSAHHVSRPPGFLERRQVPLQPKGARARPGERRALCPPSGEAATPEFLPADWCVFFFYFRTTVRRWEKAMLGVVPMLAYRFSTSRLLYSKTKAVPNRVAVLKYPKKARVM